MRARRKVELDGKSARDGGRGKKKKVCPNFQ